MLHQISWAESPFSCLRLDADLLGHTSYAHGGPRPGPTVQVESVPRVSPPHLSRTPVKMKSPPPTNPGVYPPCMFSLDEDSPAVCVRISLGLSSPQHTVPETKSWHPHPTNKRSHQGQIKSGGDLMRGSPSTSNNLTWRCVGVLSVRTPSNVPWIFSESLGPVMITWPTTESTRTPPKDSILLHVCCAGRHGLRRRNRIVNSVSGL